MKKAMLWPVDEAPIGVFPNVSRKNEMFYNRLKKKLHIALYLYILTYYFQIKRIEYVVYDEAIKLS